MAKRKWRSYRSRIKFCRLGDYGKFISLDRSQKIFARICKNPKNWYGGGGYFTAIWNPRNIVEGSVFDEIEKEIKHIVPELTRVSSGSQNAKKWEDILISTGHFKDCFFMECDYVEEMDKNRYIGAWKSVNDIQAQAGVKRWNQILSMIEKKIEVFEKI